MVRTLTEKSTREKERRGESRVISIMERTDDRSGRRVRAIRVYTLCQESRYLIVRNVPALGCIDELVKLFALYGPIEE